jgi:hypothetical protein
MEDLFISLVEIEKDIKQIEELGKHLNQQLNLLKQNIEYIFSQIKICDKMEKVNWYFMILDKIQGSLISLVCEENINLPDKLFRFIKDFDNFEEAKKHYYPKIKSGEYFF